ncbi:MAG: DUF5916 domain-containing protein [Bacteroidota bacterium]
MKLGNAFLLTFLMAVISAGSGPGLAQLSKNQRDFSVGAVRIQGEIDLTGRLSDPQWRLAPTVECPFEIQPGENTPAKMRTWVKILYNADYLYFGFACQDSNPSAIRAHVSDRDNNFEDDFVFVALDTYRDNQRAYEFVVNPLGIQGDLMRTSNNEDPSWDAVWYSHAAVNDTGYTVEIAVPFKSIHFPTTETQDWSMMIIRNYPRDSRYQNSWTPVDRNDPCTICQGGTLKGLTGIESTASLDMLPYAMGYESGNLSDENDPGSGFTSEKVKGRFGGSLKYAPDPSLTLEAVVNPDFSQVESDATQLSVNTTFAIFYPEKRPFFLDGADLFTTQTTAFYSRMINNPLAAVKMISKSRHWTFAYLGAEDRNTPFIVPGEEGSSFFGSSLRSFSNIVRAKYDFGTQSFVGALATTRNLSDGHNYAGGVDWNFFFGDNYTFLGQALFSNTKEVNDTSLYSDNGDYGSTGRTKSFDGQSFGGTGIFTQLRRDARDYGFRISYQDFSPTFQTQDGFVTANDLRTVNAMNYYNFYPNGSLLDQGDVFLQGVMHFNSDDLRKERWAIVGTDLTLKSQTYLSGVYVLYNEELFHGVRFYGVNRGELAVNSHPTSEISTSIDVQLGKFIYRADDPSLGYGHVLSASLTLKPVAKLEVDLSFSRSRLSDVNTHELLFDGYIARCVGIYQFNRDVFVRLIGQYDGFNKAFEIDPLFSYKLNPFTIFYAGSTHSLTDFGPTFGIRQTARQYFLKLQYLWRT